MTIEQSVLKTIKYFSNFAYYPTLEEIYTFLPKKIDKMKLKIELKRLKYTPPQYSIPTSPRLRGASKYQISKKKLENWRYRSYIKLLSLFPQIKLVSLSGSISMMNAGKNDDIDLFIITAKNRLFTGRLIALVLAQLFRLRRSRKARYQKFFDGKQQTAKNLVSSLSKDKICLNLFFDEKNLKVPKFKQTIFVGHEVLQMKPIIIKGDICKRFLEANEWVFKLFPNAFRVIPAKAGIHNNNTGSPIRSGMTSHFLIFNLIFNFSLLTFDFVELILKKFQLSLIDRHRTTEIITPTQLWFHPDDFEKKIKY